MNIILASGEDLTIKTKSSNIVTVPDASGTIALTSDIPSAVTESTVAGWGFTKNTGTLTDITVNGVSASVSGGVADVTVAIPSTLDDIADGTTRKLENFYFVMGSSSQAGSSASDAYLATRWEGTIPGVTTAVDGLKIAYRIKGHTGVNTGGVVLTIDGSNYYPVVLNSNTKVTTHFPIGATVLMVFNSSQSISSVYLSSNTKSTITGCWQIADYNTNTTYGSITDVQAIAGTATTPSRIAPNVLKTAITTHAVPKTGGTMNDNAILEFQDSDGYYFTQISHGGITLINGDDLFGSRITSESITLGRWDGGDFDYPYTVTTYTNIVKYVDSSTNYAYTYPSKSGTFAMTDDIPAAVTSTTVASWGFLSSESDPVFASSVAASISAADITNWNSKTSNTGTVTGSSLTADKIVLGAGNSAIKNSTYSITTTAPSSGSTNDTIPTSSAVYTAISTAIPTIKTFGGQSLLGTGDVIYKVSTTSEKPYLRMEGANLGMNKWIISYNNNNGLAILDKDKFIVLSGSWEVLGYGSGYDELYIKCGNGDYSILSTTNMFKMGITIDACALPSDATDHSYMIVQYYSKPSTGIPASDIAGGVIPTVTTVAPSSGSTNDNIPTSSAVYSAIDTALTTVLKYKGTIGTGGTVTSLPASHKVGDVYVVSTAGTFAGKACEVGDYIICKTSGTSANNAHWDVVNGENQVDNKAATLAAAGASVSIATVDGTDITISTPSTWTGVDKTGTITGISMNGASKGTSGNVDLGTVITAVSFNGTAASISNGVASITATIPTVNNTTITIQKNGTTAGTFTTNATSASTVNISVNELPTVTSSQNGQVLQVVNGSWTLVTPVSIYSGTSNPDSSQGTNGDLYLQTS